MNSPTDPGSSSCPACGQPGMVVYCSRCGEKRREAADWKLSKIGGDIVSEITDLEQSKLWRTLRLLLLKPGQLTRDYWDGSRKPFVGPVKLYLVFFALSLLLYSIHQPTAVYDVRTLAAADEDGSLPRLLERQAAQRGVSTAQFAQEVNTRWQRYISMSQLAYPFFVALALKCLFLRRKFFFTQHLVFALHLLAFMFFSISLFWPIYFALGVKPSFDHLTPAYVLLTLASIVWTAGYLFLALRRAYGEGRLAAALKGAAVYVIYFVASMVFLWLTFTLAIRGAEGGM